MGARCERGEPVIFGKPYIAPKLKLRVVDENTNQPLIGIEITVLYVWEWLEYPYPERPFGVWSEEKYSSLCVTNKEGIVEVDEFKVLPQGWYKGIHSIGRKPRFTHMEVSMALTKCFTSESLKRGELDKNKRSDNREITLKTSCNALSR